MTPDETTEALLATGSIAKIGQAYREGRLSVATATHFYLDRIARFNAAGPCLNAVKSISSSASQDAHALDRALQAGNDLGPLHGIPVLIKANVMLGEQYTVHAGVAALKQFRPTATAQIVKRLRAAGALILGQTNLTEFADYVADTMPAGFSGAEGVVRNPHGIPYGRGQGSSVGSAAAIAASFAPLAVGGETQNSIQTPASYSSVVGYKPSVGAIGRAGIIPLVPSQDAAGFLGRCVADVVLAVRAVSGADPRDSVSLERAQQLREGRARLPDSLESVRIGVPRKAMADREQFSAVLPHFQRVLDALAVARATIIDPCDLPSAEQLQEMRSCVFATEFKASVNAFLEDHLAPCGIGSLADLIAWNSAHPECIPYGQSLLINAQNTIGLHHDDYLRDRARDIALSRTAGIDAALGAHNADVLLAPMGAAAKCTGKAGAPTLAIPFGVDVSGTPFGVTLYSRIGNDRALEAVAALVERAVGNRVIPRL